VQLFSKIIKQNPGCNVVFQLITDQKTIFPITKAEYPQGIAADVKKSYWKARKSHPINCFFDPKEQRRPAH